MAYVYRHIRLDKNEPFYIGIGVSKYRANSKSNRNNYWHNIAKNGYEVDILVDNITVSEAKQKEIEFIKLYGRKDLGTGILCNLTDGGDGIINVSQESKEKMKKHHIGVKRSLETRKKLSDSRKGKKYKPMSDETKKKIGNIHRGKVLSKETKEKMSLSKGKKIISLNITTNEEIEHKSLISASKELGYAMGYIWQLLNGKRKSPKYIIKYIS